MASKTYSPGDAFAFWASTYNGSVQTDADTLPTASLYRNGTLDAAVAVTVAKISTGLYRVTGTIPVGYALGDEILVRTVATVGGLQGDKRDDFRLDVATFNILSIAYEGTETLRTFFRIARSILVGLSTGNLKNFLSRDGTKVRVKFTIGTDRTEVIVDGSD